MDYPSPHMVALLDALAARQDIVAHVLYLDDHAPGRQWKNPRGGLAHSFLPGLKWTHGTRLNLGILKTINRTEADIWVVNTCYTSPSTFLAALWLDWKKIPWVYMNEPPRTRDWILSTARLPLLNRTIGRASGVIGTGRKAENIYAKLLSGQKPTDSVPYYIDLDCLYNLPPLASLADNEPVQFVTSCQMITRKGLDILLDACKLLPADGWILTLAGEGPLRARLEEDFGQRWDRSRVRFIGQVPYDERASVFAGKHVFVFPSRWDGWGMVVPEALAAGLPVVSCEGVISAHEFIRNGENGFITTNENAPALAKHMTFFIENHDAITRMGLAARRSLESYRADIGASKLVSFLREIERIDLRLSNPAPVCSEHPGEVQTWKSLTSPPRFLARARLTARQVAKSLVISTVLKTRTRIGLKGDRILAYHLILPEDKKRFEEHLKFLFDHFELCTVAELLAARNRSLESGRCRAAISFDDGFRVLMGDCLEICQKYGIRATHYVPTGFVQLSTAPELASRYSLRAHYYNAPLEPMRHEDLRLLADLGHEVGSHGCSHTRFSLLTQQVAYRELVSSMRQIEEWTGKTPAGFAYPYGDLDSSLGQPTEWVRSTGYRYAVTLRRGPITRQSDSFRIPRDHVEGNWRLNDLRYFLFS